MTQLIAGGRSRPPVSRLWSAHPMISFTLRRLLALVLLLLGMTVILFILTAIVPGNPARAALGPIQSENPQAVAAWDQRNGLDKPLPIRYLTYLWNLLHGDMGTSQQSNNPVLSDLKTYIPATVELAIASIIVAAIVGIALGLVAALRRGHPTDQLLRVGSLGGISIPQFWLALIALYVLFFKFGWLPGGGRLSPAVSPPHHITGMYTADALLTGNLSTFENAFSHLVLPTLVLSCYTIGYIARYTRTAVLEVMNEDYIRCAYAKGLKPRTVVLRYTLRAALPSMIQVLGLAFAAILTGAVLIESIFSWPGIGQYAYHSAVALDLPSIAGVSLFVAVIYIVVNFVVDVLYGVIDPRIRVT
jgi:peptide/nickel transport system permease protein